MTPDAFLTVNDARLRALAWRDDDGHLRCDAGTVAGCCPLSVLAAGGPFPAAPFDSVMRKRGSLSSPSVKRRDGCGIRPASSQLPAPGRDSA